MPAKRNLFKILDVNAHFENSLLPPTYNLTESCLLKPQSNFRCKRGLSEGRGRHSRARSTRRFFTLLDARDAAAIRVHEEHIIAALWRRHTPQPKTTSRRYFDAARLCGRRADGPTLRAQSPCGVTRRRGKKASPSLLQSKVPAGRVLYQCRDACPTCCRVERASFALPALWCRDSALGQSRHSPHFINSAWLSAAVSGVAGWQAAA